METRYCFGSFSIHSTLCHGTFNAQYKRTTCRFPLAFGIAIIFSLQLKLPIPLKRILFEHIAVYQTFLFRQLTNMRDSIAIIKEGTSNALADIIKQVAILKEVLKSNAIKLISKLKLP